MLNKKTPLAAGLAAFITIVMAVGCAATGDQAAKSDKPEKVDYTKMSSKDLAEHLTMNGGFRFDLPVQEGGTAEQRQIQDELQKMCTATRNKPTPEQKAKIMADARASIKYPEEGIRLGDWRRGRELAWSGFGFRIGHNNDDHSKREVGGNCYNCHALATDRTGGNIGPSLTGYGKSRGNSEAVRRFVYEMIYNPHTYFPCTDMPRMGAKGLLTHEQIADLMAYILDPESPVNK